MQRRSESERLARMFAWSILSDRKIYSNVKETYFQAIRPRLNDRLWWSASII